MEILIYKFIDWIKASSLRKRRLKILTAIYSIIVFLYFLFFFSFKNNQNVTLELIGAVLFYLIIMTFTLTFKKYKNEKLEK